MTSTKNIIETEKVHPSDGFVVCLDTAWSGIYNIGVTKNTPADFLKKQNDSYHFTPSKPYSIRSSKRVEDPEVIGKIFYDLMYKYDTFSHKEIRFYEISDDQLLTVLRDMDFKSWITTCQEEYSRDFSRKTVKDFRFQGKTYRRNYFGHTWEEYSDKWVGIYDYRNKTLDRTALEPEPEPQYDYDSD